MEYLFLSGKLTLFVSIINIRLNCNRYIRLTKFYFVSYIKFKLKDLHVICKAYNCNTKSSNILTLKILEKGKRKFLS